MGIWVEGIFLIPLAVGFWVPLVGFWAEGIFVIPLAVGIYGIHEEIWICEIQLEIWEICHISPVKVSWISEDWEIGWVYLNFVLENRPIFFGQQNWQEIQYWAFLGAELGSNPHPLVHWQGLQFCLQVEDLVKNYTDPFHWILEIFEI